MGAAPTVTDGCCGTMGCQAGGTTPTLSQRAPDRAFGLGGSRRTPGLGVEAGLPTALRVLQHRPRRPPPPLNGPCRWAGGEEALYGGALGATGCAVPGRPARTRPLVWGGVEFPQILPADMDSPPAAPWREEDTPPHPLPPPKTLGSKRRAGRFSTHLHCCRHCQWGRGTKTAGGEVASLRGLL